MPRKRGALLPLEIEILQAATEARRTGDGWIHGFALAKVPPRRRRRLDLSHGTLYKALAADGGRVDRRPLEGPREALANGRPRRRLYQMNPTGRAALARAMAEAQAGSAIASPRIAPHDHVLLVGPAAPAAAWSQPTPAGSPPGRRTAAPRRSSPTSGSTASTRWRLAGANDATTSKELNGRRTSRRPVLAGAVIDELRPETGDPMTTQHSVPRTVALIATTTAAIMATFPFLSPAGTAVAHLLKLLWLFRALALAGQAQDIGF